MLHQERAQVPLRARVETLAAELVLQIGFNPRRKETQPMRIGRLRCLKVVCIGIEIVANVLRKVVAQCHGNVTGVLDEGTRPITAISSEIAREDGLIVGDMGLDPLLCESEIHGRGPNQRRVQGVIRYVGFDLRIERSFGPGLRAR